MTPQFQAKDIWLEEVPAQANGLPDEHPPIIISTPAERIMDELASKSSIEVRAASIDFKSGTWDFSACTDPAIPKPKIRITFLPHRFGGIARLWTLFDASTSDDKMQSVLARARRIDRFLEFLSESGVSDISMISEDVAGAYMKKREITCQEKTLSLDAARISTFLRFYEATVSPLVNCGVYETLGRYRAAWQPTSEEDGFLPIPESYLKPLVAVSRRVAADVSASYSDRVMACVTLIASQTGTRGVEIAGIECDAIRLSKAPVDGEPDIPYLVFKSPKPAKGDGQWIEAKCLMNGIALEAFRIALELCAETRDKKGLSALFVFKRQKNPFVSTSYLNTRFREYIMNHRREIPCFGTQEKYPELATCPARSAAVIWSKKPFNEAFGERYPDLSPDDTLVHPTIHQFRPTIATELRRQGKDWRFIQTQMTHLSEDSQDSYVYDREDVDRQFSESVYRIVFEDGAKMMGKHADSFMQEVRSFIEGEGLNVADSLEEVIAAAAGRYTLKEKLGGVCTRCGQVLPCPDDKPTDDLLCAFGVCPNHCHFFHNAGYSYQLARERAAVVDYNKSLGRTKAAENETRKLQNGLRDFLLPELSELESELERRGRADVLKRHPDLASIVTNLEKVKGQVDAWMTL